MWKAIFQEVPSTFRIPGIVFDSQNLESSTHSVTFFLVLIPPFPVNQETHAAVYSNHKDFSNKANPSKKRKKKIQEGSQNLAVYGINQIAWVPILILLFMETVWPWVTSLFWDSENAKFLPPSLPVFLPSTIQAVSQCLLSSYYMPSIVTMVLRIPQ